MPKTERGCIYRVGVRVRGVSRGFRASDSDLTVRGGGRLGEGLVGCEERSRAERREEK